MLRVRYDPNDLAASVADGAAVELAEHLVEMAKDKDIDTITSSEVFVLALRIMVKREKISHHDIEFLFVTQLPDEKTGIEPVVHSIQVDRHGNLSENPPGFCAVMDKLLAEMIGW